MEGLELFIVFIVVILIALQLCSSKRFAVFPWIAGGLFSNQLLTAKWRLEIEYNKSIKFNFFVMGSAWIKINHYLFYSKAFVCDIVNPLTSIKFDELLKTGLHHFL